MSTLEPTRRDLNAPAAPPKPVLDLVRHWFAIDVFVLATAGLQCFILASSTDRWFAWTVSPPISAAVLGAGYFGSIVMVFEARRARRWVDARVVILSTLLFASLTLAVTLRHLDKFHLDTGPTSARLAAVAWLVIYVAVSPFVLFLVVQQRQARGVEPERVETLLSRPSRVLLLVEGCLLVALGVVLSGGARRAEFWPWKLTDLTARAISAWLIALGAMLALCAAEREVARTRYALHSAATAAFFWILAVSRFRSSVQWDFGGALTIAAPVTLIATVIAALKRSTGEDARALDNLRRVDRALTFGRSGGGGRHRR
jgi:hypothetical protein